jgi:ubiquinone/menaquinone biosynthesis C-methylase UbiE
MTAEEAFRLIRLPQPATTEPQTWADLGAGQGLFSQALLHQLPANSQVYAVDRDTTPPKSPGIVPQIMNFVTEEWPFPPLNGILMANSLHFVQDQHAFLRRAAKHLLPGGIFLFVEYDTDTPNPWVPYPLSFSTLQALLRDLGMHPLQKIHTMPSKFGRAQLYSAWHGYARQ